MKKTLLILLTISLLSSTIAYAQTLYAPDGRTINVDSSSADSWKAVGWFDYPVMNIYSANGKKIVIAKSEFTKWKSVGWYNSPVMTIYAPDGRTATISESDYDKWKAVGWSSTPNVASKYIVNIGEKIYYIGMPRSEMDTPDEKLQAIDGYTWYIYGTKTYKDFVAVGMYNGNAVAIAAAGPGFEYEGYKAGSETLGISNRPLNLCIDIYDAIIVDNAYVRKYPVHAVMVTKDNLNLQKVINDETLAAESKLTFHLTNAFRVYHNKSILKWSPQAAKASQLHSQDMADNNYTSHTSLDGTSASARLYRQGVRGCITAENLTSGSTVRGFSAYTNWVSSSGHRENLLKNQGFLGAGAGYSSTTNKFYFTQNFHN